MGICFFLVFFLNNQKHFIISQRQFMCDLVGQNHDLYYENLKAVIFNKLDQNKDQMNTIEE